MLELQLQQTTAPVLPHFIQGHHMQELQTTSMEYFTPQSYVKEIQFQRLMVSSLPENLRIMQMN